MSKVDFIYNQITTTIECNYNEKMKEIFEKFSTKIGIDLNAVYFIYLGNKIKEELNLEQIINEKKIDNIKIFVHKIEDLNNKNLILKSGNIICPICKEIAIINIKDYKINISGCKYRHIINDILFDKFENTQNTNIPKIICDNCKKWNKNNINQNLFYRCCECEINLCNVCQLNHNKNHRIINYEKKDYFCKKHNEIYRKYCNTCKLNICLSCETGHISHNTLSIMKNEKIIFDINKLREKINIMNNNIKDIIKKLNIIIENFEIYFKIYNDIIKNYNNKYRNYQLLQNINGINNNDIIKDINKIMNENNMTNKIKNLFEIYNKMTDIKNKEIVDNDINKFKNFNLISQITSDSYGGDDLSNSFCAFNSINNILHLIYSTEDKSIIDYDLNSKKIIKKLKSYHNEHISNIRYYLDIQNNIDLIITSSFNDNNIKLWNINNWTCILNISNANKSGYLNSACLLNDNKKKYIISSNCNFTGNSEPIKVFDIKGHLIKEIDNSIRNTFFITTYYDKINSKNLILSGNVNNIISYDIHKNEIYNIYYDKDNYKNGNHCNLIVYNNDNENEVKLMNLFS